MYHKPVSATVAFAMAALLATASGCSPKLSPATLSTVVGGRQVRAVVDNPAFVSSEGGAAVITSGGRKLVVEKDRILLDGKEQVKLPAEAQKVDIEYVGGKLTVTADGVPVEVLGQQK
jgi:hypothetical protein